MNRRDALKSTALLMGYTVSASTLTSLLNSCKSDTKLDWQPQFFTHEQAKIVADMAECILPATDTPGANDLQLAHFVDEAVNTLLSPEEQQQMKQGVDAFAQACEDTYGKSFSKCSPEQQHEFLMKYERESPKQVPSIWGYPTSPEKQPFSFYRTLKDFTMLGYFTSQKVGKELLAYDPVPGGFVPCMPVSEAGTIWTEG